MKHFGKAILFSFITLTLGIRSTSAATVYTTNLSGANEVPAVASTATGTSVVTLSGDSLSVFETFSGLVGGPAVAAHIHCCGPIGINEAVALPFTGFPSTTSGTYSMTFDLTSSAVYTAAFITASGGTAAGAESALIASLNSGQAYANIHNATNPAGEIRGQLALAPEPGTMMLGGVALSLVAILRRRSLRQS